MYNKIKNEDKENSILDPFQIKEIPQSIKKELGTIHNITFPRQGSTSNVGIVKCDKGLVVLKRATGQQYSEWLKKESTVLQVLAHTDLPVPSVYQFLEQANSAHEMQSWLCMEFLQGETIREVLTDEKDASIRHEILSSFGEELRRIHNTSCPPELKRQTPWLEEMLKQAESNLNFEATEGTPELLEHLKLNQPSSHPQTLIHGDCTIDNFLVAQGKIVGIIDWSGGAYGDPRYDVALATRPKPNLFQASSDYQAFFDGYGEKIITEEQYVYFADGLYEFF